MSDTGEGKLNLRNLLKFFVIGDIIGFIIACIIVIPFFNANYIIETGGLLMGIYSITHLELFSNGFGPFILIYFQEHANYYFLLLGWSTKEVALIDTLEEAIPVFAGVSIAIGFCIILVKGLSGK